MIDRLYYEQRCHIIISDCEIAKGLNWILALSHSSMASIQDCSLPGCGSWRAMCSQSLNSASTCVRVLAVHLGFILLTLILCLKFSEEMTQLPMPYKLFCPEEARIKEDGGKRQAFQICIVCERGPGPRSGLTFEIY